MRVKVGLESLKSLLHLKKSSTHLRGGKSTLVYLKSVERMKQRHVGEDTGGKRQLRHQQRQREMRKVQRLGSVKGFIKLLDWKYFSFNNHRSNWPLKARSCLFL